jgi:phosphoglycerate dehydrogenase-like enzyme
MVGLGQIGAGTALRAKGLRLQRRRLRSLCSAGTEIAIGIERISSLEALLDGADIVSLHCPPTAETRKMIRGSFPAGEVD